MTELETLALPRPTFLERAKNLGKKVIISAHYYSSGAMLMAGSATFINNLSGNFVPQPYQPNRLTLNIAYVALFGLEQATNLIKQQAINEPVQEKPTVFSTYDYDTGAVEANLKDE